MKENYIEFKLACEGYLSRQGINVLRAYGRKIGVEKPTTKNKTDLVKDIVAVLSGEQKPIEPTLRGAPIKNDYVDPEVLETIEGFRHKYFDVEYVEDPWHIKMMHEIAKNPAKLMMYDGDAEYAWDDVSLHETYCGQLQTLDGVAFLLPLSCNESDSKNILVPVDVIRKDDLREGDVLRCKMRKMDSNRGWVVFRVLERNGVAMQDETPKRPHFEEGTVMYPSRAISFIGNQSQPSVTVKGIEWLMPIKRGQRACVVSSPKAGKTNVLYQLTKAALENNTDLITYVLLIEQTPEIVTQFRAIVPEDQIVYTTYEDDAEKQVFTANFILKRAIRQVESGKDVLLVVDSLNALASAFNNTDESSGGKVLAGGLESKTVQFLKKYFGSARAQQKGKTLTIVGALSKDTGSVADNILCTELCALANLEIHLSDELALNRIYPAFDFLKTRFLDGALTKEQSELDAFLRARFIPGYGGAELLRLMRESKTLSELIQRVEK